MSRYYIGLAATIHDPALAIIGPDGSPLFAEATERYLQCKRAYNCPPDDLIRIPGLLREYCEPDAEFVVAVSWSMPYLSHLEAAGYAALSSVRTATGTIRENSWPLPDLDLQVVALRNSIRQAGLNLLSSSGTRREISLRHYDHHLTHAANAVYTSPFEECVVAVVDGYGEWRSTNCYHWHDGCLNALEPSGMAEASSLGFFYGRLCALCGFDPVQGEEWKVMGLAPYGEHDPALYDLLRPLIKVEGLRLTRGCSEQKYQQYWRKLRLMARAPNSSPLESANLAHTGQQVFEETMIDLLQNLHARGLSENLTLSGGCALNSSCNGQIVERTGFKKLHVPSAPGDDGNALGAAFLAYCEDHLGFRPLRAAQSPYLGSPVDENTLHRALQFGGFSRVTHAVGEVHLQVARLLAEGKLIGWMQGRAEFGPRALGNRSILADPRPWGVKERINRRVKFRESFRPFAPSILDDFGSDYFESYQPSPYMERTLRFRASVVDAIPGVVHVNGTGRLQSVRPEWNQRYDDLIRAFHALTGVPLLLNTSFNIMGKPIIHSVADALAMFQISGLDALAIENYLFEK